MSLINRETDYAIRILRALSGGEMCPIPQICKDQKLTKAFAYKISKKLEKGGLIGIKRGISGGLYLTCDLSKISLWDIMNTLDNLQYVNDCFVSGYKCECASNAPCKTHQKLIGVQNSIDQLLKASLLSDFI